MVDLGVVLGIRVCRGDQRCRTPALRFTCLGVVVVDEWYAVDVNIDVGVIRARRCLQLDVYQTKIPCPTQTNPVGNFSPPFRLLSTSIQLRLQPFSNSDPLNKFPSLLLLGHLIRSPDQYLRPLVPPL